MAPTLDDAWAKVEWAHRQFVRLDELLEPFIHSKPYLVREEVNPKGTHRVLTAEFPSPVPTEVAFLFGDFIHALHSTLDYVVCSHVEASGQPVRTAHGFPIFPSRSAYNVRVEAMLRHVPDEVIALIEGMQPYHERERAEAHGLTAGQAAAAAESLPLMRLYRLSIEEKHRALLLATAVFSSIGMYVGHDRPADEGSGIGFRFSPPMTRRRCSFPSTPKTPANTSTHTSPRR